MAICRASSASWMSLVAALTTLVSVGASAQQAVVRPSANITAAKSSAKAPALQVAPATGTRFVVGLAQSIDIDAVKIRLLENPSRLLIDLPHVGVNLPDQPLAGAPAGVVKSFRH